MSLLTTVICRSYERLLVLLDGFRRPSGIGSPVNVMWFPSGRLSPFRLSPLDPVFASFGGRVYLHRISRVSHPFRFRPRPYMCACVRVWTGTWRTVLRHVMIGGWVSLSACRGPCRFRFCVRWLCRFRFCVRVFGPHWVCLPAVFPLHPGPRGVLLPKG